MNILFSHGPDTVRPANQKKIIIYYTFMEIEKSLTKSVKAVLGTGVGTTL